MGRGRSKVGIGGAGVAGVAGGPIGTPQPTVAPTPPITPGQPVPAITVQQLQNMSDTDFVNYLAGLRNTPIDKNTYYNNDWDTQRLVANMPELNQAPTVVDPGTFASLPGETIYRTVNKSGSESAIDICGRTMSSDVTTIGEGRMGDGFYFSTSKDTSQLAYGNHRNNLNLSATMSAKLNSSAKVVNEDTIKNMLRQESAAVQKAVGGMKSGGSWSGSGIMAYALRKGYNAVRSTTIVNVIDRRAATWSGEIIPVK